MLEKLKIDHYGGGYWKVVNIDDSSRSILVDRETAFILTALQAISFSKNEEPKDEWWWKYVDTVTYIPSECFIPISRVDALLLEDHERRLAEMYKEKHD